MRVHELMTVEVITAVAGASLKEVARLMLGNQVSGIPIVDDDERLVGIVTEADIVHREALRAGGARMGVLHTMIGDDEPIPTTAGEAMTGHVITASSEMEHTSAARLMETKGVKRLPVVDADGHIVGIISRSDIMASFARPDELIEDEIQVDILDRILWSEPGAVSVEVVDGRVTLRGSVPKRTDAKILAGLTGGLDGVVEVNIDGVTYLHDDTKTDQASAGIPFSYW